MKRTILAGTFFTLAGAAALLLAASVIYSCRGGGDPHHEGSSPSHDAQTEETHSSTVPRPETEGPRLVQIDFSARQPSGLPPTGPA